MHPASGDRPTQRQLILPLLDVLADAGGAVRPREAAEMLAERAGIPDDVRADVSVSADGQRTYVWRRHVRYAKLKAERIGLVASDGRGGWRLTERGRASLDSLVPTLVAEPILGRDGSFVGARFAIGGALPTEHLFLVGDARDLPADDASVNLVVTSPPYGDLLRYDDVAGQLGHVHGYDAFLREMESVLGEMFRILAPAGRLAINVGDILIPRAGGRRTHEVLPLHADLTVQARSAGFKALTGTLWRKTSNLKRESGAGGQGGQPGMPLGTVVAGFEHNMLFKKDGTYRSRAPRAGDLTPERAEASRIDRDDRRTLFAPIWTDVPGARKTEDHPCPWPFVLPHRLIRAHSYAGDIVCDPFAGSGTTAMAALAAGRSSISIDVSSRYARRAAERFRTEALDLAPQAA